MDQKSFAHIYTLRAATIYSRLLFLLLLFALAIIIMIAKASVL